MGYISKSIYGYNKELCMKYRKRPVIIEAVQWTGGNHRTMFDFLTNNKYKDEPLRTYDDNFYIDFNKVDKGLVIKTLEGEHIASVNDYIIRGVGGEFYPCKPDIFNKTYEGL